MARYVSSSSPRRYARVNVRLGHDVPPPRLAIVCHPDDLTKIEAAVELLDTEGDNYDIEVSTSQTVERGRTMVVNLDALDDATFREVKDSVASHLNTP